MGRKAYFINELERAEDGGYIPCIAEEDEPGYWKTDWNWGTDLALAEQAAKEKNAALEIDEKTAFQIVLSSMRPV